MNEQGVGLVPIGIVIASAFVCTVLIYFTFYAAPRAADVSQSQEDYLVSPDMVKYMEHEGHGGIFSEEDMQ
jgi:hypothetical protein